MTACQRCKRPLKDPVSVKAGMGPICRAKSKGDNDMPQQDVYGQWVDEIYEYDGFWKSRAKCGLRTFRPEGKLPVIVCTELPDNQSTSVTNMAEHLATRIAGERGLSRFVWIERYPDGHCGYELIPEHFSVVKFTFEEDGRLHHPEWRHAEEAEVRELCGLEVKERSSP